MNEWIDKCNNNNNNNDNDTSYKLKVTIAATNQQWW